MKNDLVEEIKNVLRDPYWRLQTWLIPERAYIQRRFQREIGKRADLDHPQTLNEKIQYLKLHHHPAAYPALADKYEVRNYVSAKGLGWTLNELIGVYESVDEIDFEALPNAFALKMTNASTRNIICADKSKLDWRKARQSIRRWARSNYYYAGREWIYRSIRPRIVIEAYLSDGLGALPTDYKIHCFEGVPLFVDADFDRDSVHKRNVYDLDWNLQPYEYGFPTSQRPIPRPANLEEMIEVSRILARDFFFTRVDLYCIQGRTYFGELTFLPGNGFLKFSPQEYDLYWGAKMNLGNLEKYS